MNMNASEPILRAVGPVTSTADPFRAYFAKPSVDAGVSFARTIELCAIKRAIYDLT